MHVTGATIGCRDSGTQNVLEDGNAVSVSISKIGYRNELNRKPSDLD